MYDIIWVSFSRTRKCQFFPDVPEEYSDEDHEGREDPYDKNPLVENVVEGEPHVRGQLLQAAHVLLHLEGTVLTHSQISLCFAHRE